MLIHAPGRTMAVVSASGIRICIQNDGFCITNDGFCNKNDECCRSYGWISYGNHIKWKAGDVVGCLLVAIYIEIYQILFKNDGLCSEHDELCI